MFSGLGVLIGTLPRALAGEWDQKTIFTISGPVEIPGQVLTAGTYVFKLADSQSDRNIVQVYNKDETQLYGTFPTIPDQRMRPPGKAIITFDERPNDSPEAVRTWFYPGGFYGHDFVYPKPKAVALAKANKTAVPSMPAELAANTTKPTTTLSEPHVVELRQAPLKAQTATEEEVEIVDAAIGLTLLGYRSVATISATRFQNRQSRSFEKRPPTNEPCPNGLRSGLTPKSHPIEGSAVARLRCFSQPGKTLLLW